MRVNYLILFIVALFIFTSCSSTKKAVKNRNRANITRNKDNKIEDKYKSELTKYCEEWIGVPHKMGGIDKDGIDCSGFVYNVYKEVYGITLPRRSQDMEKVVNPIEEKQELKEGDLVFFNGKQGSVNHVGIYLKDNQFIHTSSSKGVMISNLDEKYWFNIYRRGGRHPELKKNPKS